MNQSLANLLYRYVSKPGQAVTTDDLALLLRGLQSASAINTDDVDNNSNVAGSSLTNALNTLALGGGNKNNFTAVVDPTTSNDTSQGYTAGSLWLNTATPTFAVCTDNTATKAKWFFFNLN